MLYKGCNMKWNRYKLGYIKVVTWNEIYVMFSKGCNMKWNIYNVGYLKVVTWNEIDIRYVF